MWGYDTLVIIGDYKSVRVLKSFFQTIDDSFLNLSVDWFAIFAVSTDDELTVRDDARLGCRRALVIYSQILIRLLRTKLPQCCLNSFAGRVIADYANYATTRAQSNDIREHVRRAAEMRRLALNVDDRHWRFGRDAAYVAPNKFIQHHIAQHDDPAIAHRVDKFAGALFG